jgi:antitoxin (DNA-binding transcriptional repressor) of toxin-antitoxin stability system
MRQVGIRELRYNFRALERWLKAGESIEITRHGHGLARLTPLPRPTDRPQIPDVLARLRSIHGPGKLKVSGADLLRRERDER